MEFELPPYVVNEIGQFLPQSQTVDWGLTRLMVEHLHKLGITGKGIKVAVIDTGVEDHPDLGDAIVARHATTVEAYASTNGHGTGVSGVIAARNNQTGVLGIAYDSQIVSIKALDENGSGDLGSVSRAIYLAISEKCHIINLSLGSASHDPRLKEAIDKAQEAGIYVVCAAGNDGTDNSVNYPAKYPTTYAVGAINESGKVSVFSSRGWDVDIAAPGERIFTTWKGKKYARVSGTSFAAPMVSGIFALLLQAGVKITHELLQKTAIDIEETGQDEKSGYGLINPSELIKFAPTVSKPDPTPIDVQKTVLQAIQILSRLLKK